MKKSIHNFNRLTCVGDGASQTVTYIPSGEKFYLSSVMVSSSIGPCKVIVSHRGTHSEPIAIGFFTSGGPFLNMTFPVPVETKIGIDVTVLNNAGAAQDVYVTFVGKERFND